MRKTRLMSYLDMHTHMGTALLNQRLVITHGSKNLKSLLRAQTVLGSALCNHFVDSSDTERQIRHGLRNKGFWHGLVRLHQPRVQGSQDLLYVQLDCHDVGKAMKIVASFCEMNEMAHLYRYAYTDTLTGLPNRVSIMQTLQQEIAEATPEKPLALFFLDVNNFKQINDEHGHEAGDAALREIAAQLLAISKMPVGFHIEGGMVGRLAGDEFCFAVRGNFTAALLLEETHRLLGQLNFSMPFGRTALRISVSIGLAICPTHAQDISDLLRASDRAMYHAKKNHLRLATLCPTGESTTGFKNEGPACRACALRCTHAIRSRVRIWPLSSADAFVA